MPPQASAARIVGIFRPLSPVLAQTRLKSNVLALILTVFLRFVFTPYRVIRRGLIWYADEYLQHRVGGQASWASQGVWLIETCVTIVLVWNIVEAAVSVRYPTSVGQLSRASGPQMTPLRVSSPLTRQYSPSTAGTPVRATALPSTPLSGLASRNALQRYTTPTTSQADSTPSRLHHSTSFRSSPLSASTAKIFKLPSQAIESDGLFFDPEASASPSKVGARRNDGQGRDARAGQQQLSSGGGPAANKSEADGFVLVEKEEKEFIENIWTGVRARAGPADL